MIPDLTARRVGAYVVARPEKLSHAPRRAARSLVEAMGAPPAGLPPQLGTLRSTLDQRGAREPLLAFDWGVPNGEEFF